MKIPGNEASKIISSLNFLVSKGFEIVNRGYTICAAKGDIEFSMTYVPNSDVSEVTIKFLTKNRDFNIGWIAVVRNKGKLDAYDRLNNVLQQLQYIKENYRSITNYLYCEESEKLVSKYIASQRRKTNSLA